jgi:anti-sigma regulatory factor (Ser/Thr protein kinase)
VRDLFAADRAALLVLDEERQELWMRAAAGLDEAVRAQVRVPVGRGIAGRIAASGNSLLIDDVSAEHPVSEYLREHGGSLIGVPLKLEGRVLGVLHASSDRLAAFDDRDLRILTVAGERIALALERISLYEREHETAVTLQRSVLPEQMPRVERVRLAARYVPGSLGLEVGGDWYDAIDLGRGRVGIVVGDVVGKGVLAAATMAQLRNALRVYALEGLKPASVLAKLNRLGETTTPSFATLLYAVLDTEALVCRYASAGHPPPLLVRADGSAEFLEGGRSLPLGVHAEARYRHDVVPLAPGDTIVLYTDGLVERRDSTLDEGLELLMVSAREGPPDLEALLDYLLETLLRDAPSTDDVALLALRTAPDYSRRLARTFPARPSALAEMRGRLRDWLAETGVPDSIGGEIVLACSEACANAVEHAQGPAKLEFEVTAERVDDEIIVRVRDFGRWRDPRSEPDRGFGFRLIEEMMDAVEVSANDRGTEVELRRRIGEALPVR